MFNVLDMYNIHNKSSIDTAPSAADNPFEDADTAGEKDDAKDSLIFFEVDPDGCEISAVDVLQKTQQMNLDSLRHEYKRLMKISEVNEEIIQDAAEKLSRQDRFADVEMTRGDTMQSHNENWTEKHNKVTRKHSHYRHEASRIKCEHLGYETKADNIDDKNESFILDIRNIVNDIEILRHRKEVFEKAVGVDIGVVRDKAEKLVIDNEISSRLLESLVKELNDFKLGSLKKQEPSLDEGAKTEIEESCSKSVDTTEHDLNGGDCSESANDNLRVTESYILDTKESRNKTSSTVNDQYIHKESMAEMDLSNERSTCTRSTEHKVATYDFAKRVSFKQLDNRPKFMQTIFPRLDDEPVTNGYQTTRWVESIVVPKRLNNSVCHDKSTDSTGQCETKSDDSIDRVNQTQNIGMAKRERHVNFSRDVNVFDVKNRMKSIKSINKYEHKKKQVGLQHFGQQLKYKAIRFGVETKPKSENSPIPSSSLLQVAGPRSLESTVIPPISSSLTNASTDMPIPKQPNATQSDTCAPFEAADTVGNNTEGQSILKKQLPPIGLVNMRSTSPANPKQSNKKHLRMKSVSVENVLPSILPHKKHQDNGVICRLPVSSPQPVYASKHVPKFVGKAIRESATHLHRVSPSEVRTTDVNKNGVSSNLNMIGNKKQLNKRAHPTGSKTETL